MVNLHRLAALLITLLLAASLPLPARAASKPATASLGETLTREQCEMQPRTDIAPVPGLPRSQTISCIGKPVGSLFAIPFAPPSRVIEKKPAIQSAFETSADWKTIRMTLRCDPARWEEEIAAPILVIPCRQDNDGLAELVIVTPGDTALLVARGPATLYPVLRKSLNIPTFPKPGRSMIDDVRAFWSTPVDILPLGDVTQLRELMSEARSAAALEHYNEADDLFRRALEIQTRISGADDMATADIILDLALNVSNERRDDEAAALFRRAEEIIQKASTTRDRARLATYRGYEAANRGDFAKALEFARAAVSSWRAIVQQSASGGVGSDMAVQAELAMALNLEARMLRRGGDLISAYATAGEALLILNQVDGEPRWWKADVLETLGEISAARGQLSSAETFYTNALAIRKQTFGEGRGTLHIRTALGRANQAEGLNDRTIALYREVLGIASTLPRDQASFSDDDMVPFIAAIVDETRNMDAGVARHALQEEAFRAFQLVRSPIIERTIAQTSARLATDNPQAAALLRQVQDKERARDIARFRLAYEQSLPGTGRSLAVESRLSAEVDALTGEANQLRRALHDQFPALTDLLDQPAPTLALLQGALRGDEAVVSFLVGRERSFVQIIRKDALFLMPVEAGEGALRDSVKSLRKGLFVEGKSVNDFDTQEAYRLYKTLFSDSEAALGSVRHLVIVAPGPLASLPFSVLVTGIPGEKSYSDTDWLIRKASITQTPSVAAFLTLRTARPAKRPSRPLLAFGDPLLGMARPSARSASTLAQLNMSCRQNGPMPAEQLRALPSLPDTGAEMQRVALSLHTSSEYIFAGARATEDQLHTRPLDEFSVVYFATHGVLPDELRCLTEPALVLTPPVQSAVSRSDDGLLEASEIASLSFNADLAVLSACNSAAGGEMLGGEALMGLADAFFHAGARNMVISHWQVPSRATANLMAGLFEDMRQRPQDGPADGLREAQLGLVASRSTAHPFFWGAFAVMGEGASSVMAGDRQ